MPKSVWNSKIDSRKQRTQQRVTCKSRCQSGSMPSLADCNLREFTITFVMVGSTKGLAVSADEKSSTSNKQMPSSFRRRKRSFAGATWTPDSISAIVGDGVWCRFHMTRHGYKSTQLGLTYERNNKGWKLLWYCKQTGNVLQEDQLGKGET